MDDLLLSVQEMFVHFWRVFEGGAGLAIDIGDYSQVIRGVTAAQANVLDIHLFAFFSEIFDFFPC